MAQLKRRERGRSSARLNFLRFAELLAVGTGIKIQTAVSFDDGIYIYDI